MIRRAALALCAASVALGPCLVAAQALPPTVAAVVDFQRLMTESAAAKSIDDQIETRRKIYLEQLSKEEQRLYEVEKELAKQRNVLAPEVFGERRRKFEGEVQDAQRLSQEKRRQLDEARAVAINEVRQLVIKIVGELADTQGFNLVLPTSAVVMFSPSIDLTDELLKELDERLPSVRVPDNAD